jgi:hypothetical protein
MTYNENRGPRSKRRAKLLTTAGSAALATFIAAPLQAQIFGADATISPGGVPAINASVPKIVHQLNASGSDIRASVIDATAAQTSDQAGTQASVVLSVSNNTMTALAGANEEFNPLTLGQLGIDADSGLAGLTVLVNEGLVRSLVDNNDRIVEVDGSAVVLADANLNTVAAKTIVNRAVNSVTGAAPANAIGGTGTSFVNIEIPNWFDQNILDAEGGIISGVLQNNLLTGGNDNFAGFAWGNSAVADDNDVWLNVTFDSYGEDASTSASLEASGNAVSADYIGNAATNKVVVNGGAPTLDGSVVVATAQSNVGNIDSGTYGTGAFAYSNYVDVWANSGWFEDADTGFFYSTVFTGDIKVEGNSVTAFATGNNAVSADGSAGNLIELDGLSFAGDFESIAYAGAFYYDEVGAVGAGADLALANRQQNRDASLVGEVDSSVITGSADLIEGGSISVSGNTTDAKAIGNAAANAILADGGASFSGSAAVANLQDNYASSVEANNYYNAVAAYAGAEGTVFGSTLVANGNRQGAFAQGNSVTQEISISATAIELGTAVDSWGGGGGGEDIVIAYGSLLVTNLQADYDSQVDAEVYAGEIYVGAEAYAEGSSFEAMDNVQEAVAVANTAGNSLKLQGVDVGIGGGIANIQESFDSSIGASVEAEVLVDAYAAYDSDLSAAGNRSRAVGIANNASNLLEVGGTTLVSDVYSGYPGYAVGFDLWSDQEQDSNVFAEVYAGYNEAFEVLADEVDYSSVAVDANMARAVAAGNQAGNSLSLNFVTLDGYDSMLTYVARVDAEQSSSGTIYAGVSGAEMIEADVNGDVDDSSISVSENRIEALAYGNNAAANALSVKGVDVVTGGQVWSPEDDVAFALDNDQNVYGSVTASQRGENSDAGAASISVELGDDLRDSTVVAAANNSLSQALGNVASNELRVEGNSLSTSARLASNQWGAAYVQATAGQEGTDATAGTQDEPFDFNGTAQDLTGTFAGEDMQITGGYLTINAADFSDEQIAYLLDNGWELNSGVLRTDADLVFPNPLPSSVYLALNGGSPVLFNFILPGMPGDYGNPNGGGVIVSIDDDIRRSTVGVVGNEASATAIANSVSNSMDVLATSAGQEFRYLDELNLEWEIVNGTSFVLDNEQDVDSSSYVNASIYGSFGIQTRTDNVIESASFEVKNNKQAATAVANTASNDLNIAITNNGASEDYGVTSLLESSQYGWLAVNAVSDLDLFAPAKGDGSSLTISGNRNTAVAGTNEVVNLLAVTGTNIEGGYATGDNADESGSNADHRLSNEQESQHEVSAVALTNIVNNERDQLLVDGSDQILRMTEGSIAVSGNATVAEANANKASNSLSLNAGVSQSATAGLTNYQNSTNGAVTASATTNAMIALNGGVGLSAEAPVQNGAIVLNGNSTTAIARGNSATNVLTAATNWAGLNSASIDARAFEANANGPAAMVNVQRNDKSITAEATASYGIVLNGTTNAPSTGAALNVNGNAVTALAVGNSASNTLSLTATPGGTTGGAVASLQVNSGAVTATASSVTFGVGLPTGGLNSAQAGVVGNAISATAIGNSATTLVTAGN